MNDLENLKTRKPRKKKDQSQNSNPNPNQLKSADSGTSENEVNFEIEPQAESALIDSGESWMDKVKRAAEKGGILSDETTEERVETRGRKKKTAATDEFSSLIISLLVLVLSFSNIPDDVKPNDDELSVFSKHVSSLLLRHLPISSKFSQDSLDVIGLIAILSGWYARVTPAIKSHQQQTKSIPARVHSQNTQIPTPESNDPLAKLNPSAAAFLDSVEQKAANNHDE